MDKQKKLMKEKTKSYKAEKAKYMKEKMAKSGVTVELDEKTLDVKEVFASVKQDSSSVQIPNTPVITEDLREKTIRAFSEGISVAGVKI
jgi:ribosomal protein L9